MSIPPQLIRVKRKATEEAPVSYLRVQEIKRHRSEEFVYKRQDREAAFASIPAPSQKPIIHISHPTSRDAAFQGAKRKHSGDGETKQGTLADGSPADYEDAAVEDIEQRRFHLSRPDDMLSTDSYPTRQNGGITKKRSAPALFVERRIKRISSRTMEKLQAASDTPRFTTTTTGDNAPATQDHLPADKGMDVDKPETRKYKRPGVAKLASQGSSAPKAKTELPEAMTKRLDMDMDRMAEEMNAFALEQIGLNLQKAEEEQQQRAKSQKKAPTSPQLKFKPKAPAKRYSERHPEATPEPADKEMADADADADAGVSDTDDDDYIIETYVRVPASKLGENVPLQHVGLLVFDGEPDEEYFYGGGSDSDDEWAEDEEDENAENYYTADYPDDEVASDDEYDMNAYAYRNGNASDLEEYGTDDDYDDISYESKDVKNGGFKTFVNRSGFTTNHL